VVALKKIQLLVRNVSKKCIGLGLERLGFGLDLGPKIEGLEKILDRNVSFTSLR